MNPNARKTRHLPRSGFTLLEVLIVIGIIAMLFAILIPSAKRVREQAREVACMSNQRQLYAACIAFANDNDRLLPLPSRVWDGPTNTEVQKKCIWASDGVGTANLKVGAIWPYMPASEEMRRAAIKCPSDTGELAHYSSGYDSVIRNMSYSLHSRMLKDQGGVFYSISLRQVPKPSETIMIFEEIGPNDAYTVDIQVRDRWDDQPTGRHGAGTINLKTATQSQENTYRTAGRGMYCFFDGHVEALTPEQIFKNTHFYNNLPAR